MEIAKNTALETGATITLTEDVTEATKDANIVYTDVWVSMGEDKEKWGERIELLKPYQVNSELMSKSKDSAIFLHCLPSFHDLNTSSMASFIAASRLLVRKLISSASKMV